MPSQYSHATCVLCSLSLEDILQTYFLDSYPTSDLSSPSIDWMYDISYHIVTFKYHLEITKDGDIEIYLLVPPSHPNLGLINR